MKKKQDVIKHGVIKHDVFKRVVTKQHVKNLIGETWLWKALKLARYRAGVAMSSPRLKKFLYKVLPKRAIYRMLQSPAFYGANYFDTEKDPNLESGYAVAYSDLQDFRDLARLLKELFNPERALDIGCARGFQVRALREEGIDAWGIDISEYAIATAPGDVAPFIKVSGCQRTGFPDGHFDLVLLMETLEHIPPYDIERSISEARRICNGWILATIPSIGVNRYGPDGVASGKIPQDYLPLYEEGDIDMAPFEHLLLDVQGAPIHGHIIVASFDWWTEIFTRHGLIRRGDLEQRVNKEISCARDAVWNCYVLQKVENPVVDGPRIISGKWKWEQVEEGLWRSDPIEMPAGVHRAGISLKMAGAGGDRKDLHRALACTCASEDGGSVLGVHNMSCRDTSRNTRHGEGRFFMPCTNDRNREVRLELRSSHGLEIEPLPLENITLYTDL